MAFGNFTSVQDVAVPFQIHLVMENFIEPIPFPVDVSFHDELQIVLKNVRVNMSEAAVCEFMIAPILRKIWQSFRDVLTIWSHVPLGVTEPLVGVPDYFFCRRSHLGVVEDKPYVVVMEAKKDDFEAGWGQCLAAMLAAQQMNEEADVVIYGCVSNGHIWQFGVLKGNVLTQELRFYMISDLSELFAALHFVFRQAREQVLAFAA